MNDTQSQIESILFAASRPVKLGELVKTLGLGKTELLELLEKIKPSTQPTKLSSKSHSLQNMNQKRYRTIQLSQ